MVREHELVIPRRACSGNRDAARKSCAKIRAASWFAKRVGPAKRVYASEAAKKSASGSPREAGTHVGSTACAATCVWSQTKVCPCRHLRAHSCYRVTDQCPDYMVRGLGHTWRAAVVRFGADGFCASCRECSVDLVVRPG